MATDAVDNVLHTGSTLCIAFNCYSILHFIGIVLLVVKVVVKAAAAGCKVL
jgi:hypothetical protein